eukprot:5397664-Pyramimonas_sp.AAC.2
MNVQVRSKVFHFRRSPLESLRRIAAATALINANRGSIGLIPRSLPLSIALPGTPTTWTTKGRTAGGELNSVRTRSSTAL